MAYLMSYQKKLTLIAKNEVLVRIGAYEKGNDKELDLALSRRSENPKTWQLAETCFFVCLRFDDCPSFDCVLQRG